MKLVAPHSLYRLFAALFLLGMCSCASKPAAFAPVRLTGKARFILLGPEYLEAPLDMAQHIRGRYGEEEFVAEAWVKADETGVVIALFNSLGAGLGEFSFDAGGAAFSSAYFSVFVMPEYIAADFQFCFYQAEALEAALKQAGLGFQVETFTGGEIRRITENAKPIITVEKKPGSISCVNHLRGYSYILEGNF